MNDFHGIIFAYSASPELRELVSRRTAASMPIFGRYRVIDFALSSLRNAGIRDVGVIMQRDYQSLMDHIRSGKSWDMSRKDGGMRSLILAERRRFPSLDVISRKNGGADVGFRFCAGNHVRVAVMNWVKFTNNSCQFQHILVFPTNRMKVLVISNIFIYNYIVSLIPCQILFQ